MVSVLKKFHFAGGGPVGLHAQLDQSPVGGDIDHCCTADMHAAAGIAAVGSGRVFCRLDSAIGQAQHHQDADQDANKYKIEKSRKLFHDDLLKG